MWKKGLNHGNSYQEENSINEEMMNEKGDEGWNIDNSWVETLERDIKRFQCNDNKVNFNRTRVIARKILFNDVKQLKH